MKKILPILFFMLLSIFTFAKGGAGTYFIKGTAYGENKSVLKNVDLVVKIGKATQTVKTNENGEFEIEVHWEHSCRSLRSKRQYRGDVRKINPKVIYISYSGQEIKVKNKWKKYDDLFPKSKSKVTRKKNLHFS
jgi:hypothetical protein